MSTFDHDHVQAYNAGENMTSTDSQRLVKELIIPMEELPCLSDDKFDNEDSDRSSGNDKCPAPSTPQPKQVWLSNDQSNQNQSNWSNEKDNAEQYEESKSVDTTCFNTVAENPSDTDTQIHDCVVKEENDLADCCKSESDTSPPLVQTSSDRDGTIIQKTRSDSRGTRADKINRKKMKVHFICVLF